MTAQSRNAIAFITEANQSARHCFPASGMVISIAVESGRFISSDQCSRCGMMKIARHTRGRTPPRLIGS
jgi:hypothetical protein